MRWMISRAISVDREWCRVLLVAPVLLFPLQFRWLTIAVLGGAVAWTALDYRHTSTSRATPMDVPAFIVGFMALIAFAISPWPEHSLPKLAGVVLGLLVMRTVVMTVRTEQALWSATGIFLIIGVLTVIAGLLGTAPSTKFATLWSVGDRIPRLFGTLPGTDGSVNTNGLAGTTLYFLPLALVLLLKPRVVSRCLAAALWQRHRTAHERWIVAGLAAIATGLAGVLMLSQSRTGWLSSAVTGGLLVVAAWHWPRLIFGAAVVGFALSLSISDPAHVADLFSSDPGGAQGEMQVTPHGRATSLLAAFSGRTELWTRAVEEIRRFPVSGAGLNVFRFRIHTYPPTELTDSSRDVAHAHNTFLQTALDIGIPGLIAYIALLLSATAMCYQVWLADSNSSRLLALGLWGNLVGVHVFGVGDAIALGAKVGVFLWFNLGLIAALHALHVRSVQRARRPVGEPVPA